jgi:serine/threonine protein kinase
MEILNRYRLLDCVASGFQGTVFRAEDLDSRADGAIVAVKVVDHRSLGSPAKVKQLWDEVDCNRRLSGHAHILGAQAFAPEIDWPVQSKRGYPPSTVKSCILISPFAPNGELYDYIAYNGGLRDVRLCKALFLQLVDAVAFAHSCNIAHRDLKPENILISKAFTIQVCDWGLSAVYRADKGGDMRRTPVGTCGYMAPEVIAGGEYNPYAADVWSLGVVLFCMLTGYPPFSVAREGDWWYTRAAAGDWAAFWDSHDRVSRLEPESKKFLSMLLNPQPHGRPSAAAVLQDVWLRGQPALPRVLVESTMREMQLGMMTRRRSLRSATLPPHLPRVLSIAPLSGAPQSGATQTRAGHSDTRTATMSSVPTFAPSLGGDAKMSGSSYGGRVAGQAYSAAGSAWTAPASPTTGYASGRVPAPVQRSEAPAMRGYGGSALGLDAGQNMRVDSAATISGDSAFPTSGASGVDDGVPVPVRLPFRIKQVADLRDFGIEVGGRGSNETFTLALPVAGRPLAAPAGVHEMNVVPAPAPPGPALSLLQGIESLLPFVAAFAALPVATLADSDGTAAEGQAKAAPELPDAMLAVAVPLAMVVKEGTGLEVAETLPEVPTWNNAWFTVVEEGAPVSSRAVCDALVAAVAAVAPGAQCSLSLECISWPGRHGPSDVSPERYAIRVKVHARIRPARTSAEETILLPGDFDDVLLSFRVWTVPPDLEAALRGPRAAEGRPAFLVSCLRKAGSGFLVTTLREDVISALGTAV